MGPIIAAFLASAASSIGSRIFGQKPPGPTFEAPQFGPKTATPRYNDPVTGIALSKDFETPLKDDSGIASALDLEKTKKGAGSTTPSAPSTGATITNAFLTSFAQALAARAVGGHQSGGQTYFPPTFR